MKNIIGKYITLILAIFMLTGCSMGNSDYSDQITTEPSSTDETIITDVPQVSTVPQISTVPSLTPVPQITAVPTATNVPEITAVPETTTPAFTSGSKPTSNEMRAEEILANMTLEEKIGQLFFVRCRNEIATSDIKTYQLGGYILFANDFEGKSSKELKKTLKSYQKTSKIPLLIGVDEEGGVVNRISKYKQFRSIPFHSPQSLYKEGGFDLVKSDTTEKAILLKSLGINVNLAPVCDVSTDSDDFIYNRSFGKNPTETAKYVKTVVTEMNRQDIGCTLKHFPGYGNNVDTHTGISIDKRNYESFVKNDFLPFQAGIKAGAGSILVSHNIVNCMDKTLPASLSPAVHEILREDLGYNGVIMTDDLDMDAIKEYTNNKEAAVLAITAGNDLIIATDFDIQIPAVIAAVKNNTITEDRINESVIRVLIWKLSLGIIS